MLSNNPISLEERTDLTQSESKLWRALIRVSSLEKDKVGFIIPGWDSQESVYFDINQLPENIIKNLKVNYRFYAPFNLGITSSKDIYIDIEAYEE